MAEIIIPLGENSLLAISYFKNTANSSNQLVQNNYQP
jgi:hypothetical protein